MGQKQSYSLDKAHHQRQSVQIDDEIAFSTTPPAPSDPVPLQLTTTQSDYIRNAATGDRGTLRESVKLRGVHQPIPSGMGEPPHADGECVVDVAEQGTHQPTEADSEQVQVIIEERPVEQQKDQQPTEEVKRSQRNAEKQQQESTEREQAEAIAAISEEPDQQTMDQGSPGQEPGDALASTVHIEDGEEEQESQWQTEKENNGEVLLESSAPNDASSSGRKPSDI